MARTIIVDLSISAEEYLKLYEGVAQNANAVARDGRRVQFPAHILRPYVTRSGIFGTFEISFDENLKFSAIRRL